MSFKIEPKAGPTLADSGAPNISKQAEARQRAISMLTNSAPQGQGQPVPAEVRQAQTLKSEAEAPVSEGQDSTIVDASASTSSTPEAVAETPAEKKDEPLSSQYAVLARKEKQLRVKAQQQEMAFKQREEALRSRESDIAKKDTDYQSNYISKDRLKTDLLGTLAEAGFSYDEITQAAMTQPQVDPGVRALVQELRNEIKGLKDEQTNTKKSFADNQQQSYQQALNQIRVEAKSLIRDNPAYEAIRETGELEQVVELIQRTFNEDGILLTVEEAAQAVEDELVEKVSKFARLQKIQQRLKPTAASAPKQPDAQKKSPEMKTLTNSVGAARQLSARERALLAFEGKLKS